MHLSRENIVYVYLSFYFEEKNNLHYPDLEIFEMNSCKQTNISKEVAMHEQINIIKGKIHIE